MLIRILIADDHTLFREMLREVLSHRKEAYAVIGEATNGPEILQLVTRYQPDLLTLDYKMPGLGRLSAFCKEVVCRSPATRILIVSGYAEEDVALEAALGGAHGYILKGAPLADLLSAIATIYSGGMWADEHLPLKVFHTFRQYRIGKASKLEKLSRQELKILSLVSLGMSNKEIGVRLHIDQRTVKNHLTRVFAKLGVVGRRQAACYFLNRKSDNGD